MLIVIDVFAIAYAPKHVSGSECALIGLLENILAPLWVFARFGDVPSAWTVAGGALLLATLVGHEAAAARSSESVRVSQPGARGYRSVNNILSKVWSRRHPVSLSLDTLLTREAP